MKVTCAELWYMQDLWLAFIWPTFSRLRKVAFQILMALLQKLFHHRLLHRSLPDHKKSAKYTHEQKALIAKRAAEHGVIASYHRFYLKRTWHPSIFFSEIVLHAGPLPTLADSLAIHENITTNIIVFNDSRNYYPSENLRYTVSVNQATIFLQILVIICVANNKHLLQNYEYVYTLQSHNCVILHNLN